MRHGRNDAHRAQCRTRCLAQTVSSCERRSRRSCNPHECRLHTAKCLCAASATSCPLYDAAVEVCVHRMLCSCAFWLVAPHRWGLIAHCSHETGAQQASVNDTRAILAGFGPSLRGCKSCACHQAFGAGGRDKADARSARRENLRDCRARPLPRCLITHAVMALPLRSGALLFLRRYANSMGGRTSAACCTCVHRI